LSLGERVAGYAALEERAIAIQGKLKDDPRFAHLEEFGTIQSSVTVPLQRKGKLLGVINLYRQNKEMQFNQHDLSLLSIFAVEAAIAIENTNLFNSLEQEKEELDATFAGMADGAVVTDAGLRVIRCNQAAIDLLGLPVDRYLGREFPELVPDFQPSAPWETIRNHPEQTVRFELERKRGKSLCLGVMSTKISNQDEKPFDQIMVLRNVTSEKREERMKMDFLALISHKLKTPLTTINGYSSFLVDSNSTMEPKQRQALASIKRQGDMLNLLVDKLLRFTLLISEYTRLDPEKCSLHELVGRCVKGLAPMIVNEIFATISRMKREGISVLLVEQNVRRALAISDRAYVIEKGRTIAEGPASGILSDDALRQKLSV
jgi:PAS domain S-box-containing protein